MPYTPPSRSPANSAMSTPDSSRRPSLAGASRPTLPRSQHHSHHNQSQSNSRPPALPRSALYAQRSRRSPSASEPSTPIAADHARDNVLTLIVNNETVRQSPPPVTDAKGMPSGAIISPPESSDEEGGLQLRGRLAGQQVKELQQAISKIPQQRSGSPESSVRVTIPMSAPLKNAIEKSMSSATLDLKVGPPRKNGHTRSATEPHATLMMPSESSVSTEEEESESEIRRKPQMVRKKSGELVRPALRGSSHRRPSSMPGTPTFSKAVHFDSHLEHVRHFLQVDRPAAVSAGSSPVDNYDSDTEYPFPSSSASAAAAAANRAAVRQPPFEWALNARNFPSSETPARRALPVQLEKVWLSPTDQKSLIGSIVVANLAFNKAVVCRFTFDYWKTTSEVAADYSNPILPKQTAAGHDRFTFSIKLSDTANLESKTLYMCIRYTVDGAEYWDNNNGANFQIDFRKKHLPQNGKGNFQGASSRSASNTLPRSNRRGSNSSTGSASTPSPVPSSRPKPTVSMAGRTAEFGAKSSLKYEPLHEVLGEDTGPALRFKAKSMVALPSDNLSNGLSTPSGQAFANRYDFGASLRAVKDTSKDRSDDVLYMKQPRREAHARPPAPTFVPSAPKPQSVPAVIVAPEQEAVPTVAGGGDGAQQALAAARAPFPGSGSAPVPGTSSPMATAGTSSPMPGTASPSSLIATDSYDELVNKYCFFVPKQSSPTAREVNPRPSAGAGAVDGTVDGSATTTTNLIARAAVAHAAIQHAGAAQHHTLYRGHGDGRDSHSSYFPAYTLKASPTASPTAGSPARSLHAGTTVSTGSRGAQAGSSSSPRTSVSPLQPGLGAQIRSPSPASMVESFHTQPFAGASPTEEYSFAHHLQGRFPFGGDSHSSTAIRG